MLPFELTKDTPYLVLSGELWSVFYEYFNRNWSCYKGLLMYFGDWLGAERVTIHYQANDGGVQQCSHTSTGFNTLRPGQNGRHFADDIFKCIFLNKNVWIPIKISLKFVPKGPINNIPALVQIMAWHRSGDKPLSETMMVRLPTHICVTRPQWVNVLTIISDANLMLVFPMACSITTSFSIFMFHF